MKSKETEKG